MSGKNSSLAVDERLLQSQMVDFEPQLKVLVNQRLADATTPRSFPPQEVATIKGQVRISF